MNKLILLVVAVIIAGGAWYFWPVSNTAHPAASSTPAGSAKTAQSSPSTSPSPARTTTPVPSPSTTPGLIFREAQIYTVTIQDSTFAPTPLTVRQGDLVIFQNTSTFTQTVTALNKVFDSKTLYPGESWQLETANMSLGTYEYRSTLHTVIRGTLIVIQ